MADHGGREPPDDAGQPAGGPARGGAGAGAPAAAGAPSAQELAAAETGGSGASGAVSCADTPATAQPHAAPGPPRPPRPRRAAAQAAAARIRAGSAPQPAGSWDTAGGVAYGGSSGGDDSSASSGAESSSSDSGSEDASMCDTEELEGAVTDSARMCAQTAAANGQAVSSNGTGVGAFWQVHGTLALASDCGGWEDVLAGVRVPKPLLAAWFPTGALPLAISLQLEVDGVAWGPRFASGISKDHGVSKGLSRFTELAGCRMTGWRRAAGPAALDLIVTSVGVVQAAAGPKRLAVARAAEAGDEEEGAWPVASSVTPYTLKHHYMPLPTAMVAAWWPGAAFPLPVAVTVRVDGTVRRVVRAAVKNKSDSRRRGAGSYRLIAPLPLPVGSTILRFKRLGPASIELHAREPPPAHGGGGGGGGGGGVGFAAAGADGGEATPSEDEGSSSDEGEGPPAQSTPLRQRQRARRSGPPQPPPPAEQLVTEEEAAGGLEEDGSAPGPSAQHPATAPTATASAATAAAHAAHAHGAQPPDGSAAAALAVLALPTIPLPPAADSPAADALRLVRAAVPLLDTVSSVADALALAPAQRDAVLDVIESESVQPEKCTALLAMAYPRLRRAAAAGDAAAALAWMERVAARGGAGGGS